VQPGAPDFQSLREIGCTKRSKADVVTPLICAVAPIAPISNLRESPRRRNTASDVVLCSKGKLARENSDESSAASCYGDWLDNGTLGRQGLYRGAVNIGGFFIGEFQYKPHLTLILVRMGGGRWIMHHIMSLLALGFLFAVLLGIV
jgi:hypothetical protein